MEPFGFDTRDALAWLACFALSLGKSFPLSPNLINKLGVVSREGKL